MSIRKETCRQLISRGLGHVPVTILLTLSTLVIAAVPQLQSALEFDRNAVTEGEFWRLGTGHVTHWNLDHCLWDLGVFFGLGILCERRSRCAFLACLGGSVLLISLYLQLIQTSLATYRGLSGIDTGLFAMSASWLIRDALIRKDRTVVCLASSAVAAFGLKTCWEFVTQSTVFVASTGAFVPVPIAHVLGAVAGFVSALRMGHAKATARHQPGCKGRVLPLPATKTVYSHTATNKC